MREGATSYPARRTPVLARNVVATSQPLAAQAGLRMLLAGGNAVDAAVAAAAALTVVEPTSNGIGGDLFAQVWDGEALHGLNASGRAPAAWTPERFAGRSEMPQVGWESVTVPGAVSGWVALSQRFGALPFGDLLVPAMEYARDGFLVSETVARLWAAQTGRLRDQPGYAEAFLPGGRAPRAGEGFRFPDQAATLEEIGRTAGEALYRGPLGERVAAHARLHGAAMTQVDFAEHACEWVAPLEQSFQGFSVHQLPPNGQGLVCLLALGLLERLGLAGTGVGSLEALHLQIEAIKVAFEVGRRHIGDPAAMQTSPSELLDVRHLEQNAARIDPGRAQDFGPGPGPSPGTVYLTAADAAGKMVSLIQSNFMGFGSGVVVPGTGLALHNRGAGFVLEPGHPNEVAPRRRPYHTIIPGFLTQDGRPRAAFGLMGGLMQPQGHTQLLTRILAHGEGVQAAIDAPRFRVERGLEVRLEAGFPADTIAGLEGLGHRIVHRPLGAPELGCAQIAWRLEGGYECASDGRRDSSAVGY